MQIPKDVINKARSLEIRTRKYVRGKNLGGYATPWSGGGFEFRQLRDYTSGDDIRFVDWKSFARTGSLLVRDYHDEHNRSIVLILDCSSSMYFARSKTLKAERAGEIASVMAYSACFSGDAVGCVVFGDGIISHITPRAGHAHTQQVVYTCLQESSHPRGSMSLGETIKRIAPEYGRSTCFIVISDFLDDTYKREITVLAQRHDIIPIRIVDEQEESPYIAEETYAYDTETHDQILVTRDTVQMYTCWVSQHTAYFNRVMRTIGTTPCTCYVGGEWFSHVLSYMHSR